jgi:hypothetical protein
MMTAEEITTARLRVFENGYLPTAVDGKDAVEAGWRDPANVTPETIMASVERHPRASNTGGNTMYMPAFDTDIRHPEAARAAQDYLRDRFGDRGTWVRRVGMPPKCVDLFQTAAPFKKIRRELVAPGEDPAADGYKPHGVEVLCDGQQVVLFGIHPDTQRPYTYPLGATPLNTLRTELPPITEAEAIEAADDIVAMLTRDFDFVPYERPATNGHAGTGGGGGKVDVEAEIAAAGHGQLNAMHTRVIPSLLNQGWHPDEVLERLLGHAVDLGLDRKSETQTISGRILCTLNNLMMRDYDPQNPVFPGWLHPDLHADWIRITELGERPRFGRNHHGFLLRKPQGPREKPAETASGPQPETPPRAEAPPETDPPPAKEKPKHRGRIPVMLSSSAFIAGFVPPDYLMDGVLQRRFLYSFTGPTGHGKTAVILLLASCVDQGTPFAGHRCGKGSVLVLAGENPDDVRMRWIGLAEERGFDPDKSSVHFVAGVYQIPLIREVVARQAAAAGTEFALVIVDTSAAYFPGDEENSNTQLGNHARTMRECLVSLPGGPTVVITTHPVKNPDHDNLLPRGGGAFIAEVDGNLTCLMAGDVATVHWAGKYRGPDFGEMVFELTETFADALKDSEGRPMPTVTARAISDQAHTEIRTKAREEDEVIMRLLAGDEDLSTAAMAERAGWLDQIGEPNKQRAWRAIRRLVGTKLVKKDRAMGGIWALTDAGRAAIGLGKKGKKQ